MGGHVVRRLLNEGLQVVCLVRPSSDLALLAGLRVEIHGDWGDSVEKCARAMEGADYIFHVAGLTRGRTQKEYMAANVRPTEALIEAAQRGSGRLRRFVYVSSLAAVGPNRADAETDEATEPRPADFYGISKLAGERIVMSAGGAMPVTIVRPPAVYGPRDVNFLPLFRAAQRLGVVPVVGRASRLVSLVHALDLAEGIFLAATQPAGIGQTYFISSGNQSLRDVGEAIGLGVGRGVRIFQVPAPVARLIGELGELKWTLTGKAQIVSRRKVADLLQPRWTCCWEKAKRELGYKPRFSLKEGARQTAEWYRQEGWI